MADKRDKSQLSDQERQELEISRVKVPRGKEIFGILDQRLGGSRTRIRCFDGKTRICRIPGRLKRRLWVREGDLVLIEPWGIGGDEKGDLVFKYTHAQIDWLKRKGYLKQLESIEEF